MFAARTSRMRLPGKFAQHCLLIGGVTLAVAVGARVGRADARDLEAIIHADDPCPSPAEMALETWELTPVHLRAVLTELTDVSVEHRANSYRVVVATKKGSAARVFSESERDCGKRARFAAVFIVLVLIPPDEAEAPPVPAPAAIAPAATPPTPPRAPAVEADAARPSRSSSRALVRLELAGVLERAPHMGDAASALSAGARLQALVGRRAIVPVVGLSYAPPASFELDLTRATVSRVGVTAGVRGRTEVGACELALELAATMELERVSGESAASRGSDAGLQVGARGAAMVAWPNTATLQPFVSVSTQWFPEPHQLVTLPRGVIGTLPRLWIGASLGLALAL